MKKILALILIGFVVFCGALVAKSGLFECGRSAGQSCILLQQTTANENRWSVDVSASRGEQVDAAAFTGFGADNAAARSVTLGSVDPKSGFRFQLELSSKGAAIADEDITVKEYGANLDAKLENW